MCPERIDQSSTRGLEKNRWAALDCAASWQAKGMLGSPEETAWNHDYCRANGEADGWLWFHSDEGVSVKVALACGASDSSSAASSDRKAHYDLYTLALYYN
jgi:hypothetical protein